MELLGAAIKRRRRRLGWTQAEVGRRTGINQAIISRLENGRRFGLRWPRFALLIDTLGGLDFDDPRLPVHGLGLHHQLTTPNPYIQRLAELAALAAEPEPDGAV